MYMYYVCVYVCIHGICLYYVCAHKQCIKERIDVYIFVVIKKLFGPVCLIKQFIKYSREHIVFFDFR